MRRIVPTIAMALLATLVIAAAPAFAAGEELNITNVTVTLSAPATNSYNSSGNTTVGNYFVASASINGTASSVTSFVLMNCTLYINKSSSWAFNNSNSSALTNNTAFVINVPNMTLTESSTSYIWNMNCTINTSGASPPSGIGYFASANSTVMFDRGKPNITVSRPDDGETFADNPGYFSVTCNESCNISAEGFNAVNTVENISMANSSASGTLNYVFYSSDRMYWVRFNAKDQAGNTIVFSNYSFWYNVTSATGGAGGGYRESKPLVIDEVEVPVVTTEEVAEVPAPSPIDSFIGAVASIPAAIVNFFGSILALIGLG